MAQTIIGTPRTPLIKAENGRGDGLFSPVSPPIFGSYSPLYLPDVPIMLALKERFVVLHDSVLNSGNPLLAGTLQDIFARPQPIPPRPVEDKLTSEPPLLRQAAGYQNHS